MKTSTVAGHSVPDAAVARDPSPALLQNLVSSGLTDMLSTMLEAHTQVAAGRAADEQGYLLQDWRPFNSRQWLSSYLLNHAAVQPSSPEQSLPLASDAAVQPSSPEESLPLASDVAARPSSPEESLPLASDVAAQPSSPEECLPLASDAAVQPFSPEESLPIASDKR